MQEHLAQEMTKAAAAQEYEKAADLRDLLANLKRTTKKVNHFERVPYSLPLALDSARDLEELGQALGLPAPPERIEGFDISNISGTFKVASLVSFRNGRPDRSNYRRFRIKGVEGQDDFASVAEVVRRRYTRILNESRAATDNSALRTPHSALVWLLLGWGAGFLSALAPNAIWAPAVFWLAGTAGWLLWQTWRLRESAKDLAQTLT